MAGWVEVNMFHQSQCGFVAVFVDERKQFETDQQDEHPLCSFEERDNVQTACVWIVAARGGVVHCCYGTLILVGNVCC